jgi:hypothetical protein
MLQKGRSGQSFGLPSSVQKQPNKNSYMSDYYYYYKKAEINEICTLSGALFANITQGICAST